MEGGKIRWSIKEVDLIINNNHRERKRERERESDRRHPCRTSWKLPWTQRSGRRWVGLPFSILSFQKKKNIWPFSFCFSLFSDFLFFEGRRDIIWDISLLVCRVCVLNFLLVCHLIFWVLNLPCLCFVDLVFAGF